MNENFITITITPETINVLNEANTSIVKAYKVNGKLAQLVIKYDDGLKKESF